MGSSSSKFRKYLQNGDEYAALQIYHTSLELQHNLDPNHSYGDSLKHNTPIHLAARHAMKQLLRIFLSDLKGNPNKQNAYGETALHLVCHVDTSSVLVNEERHYECLGILLKWHSPETGDPMNLATQDCEGNTALHYACAAGLSKCVEMLISYDAPLFIENKFSETICDLAEKNKHEEIAQFLETKMLFYEEVSDEAKNLNEEIPEKVASGLRAQDLQEAKDQLLVETSDMFHVPLFTAEVLLRNHEWSRQCLLDSWIKDPVACCEEAGVSPPTSALNFSHSRESLKMNCSQIQNEYQNGSLNSPVKTPNTSDESMCDICTTCLPTNEDLIQVPCQHQFCKCCWKAYLSAKILDGEAHNILCPAFECHHLVPVDIIEKLVSTDMLLRYLQFDIQAFVESNPSMKWCPYPGCVRAVKLPESETVNTELAITLSAVPSVSHSVDCGNGHYFCWDCLGEAHAPCGCEKWQEWHKKISEIKPQELKHTYAETEEAENCLWMVTNSKPCPNCKCPIQKNEGCNHMKCSKCRYEFCWICQESWKKHSPATGGYFRCTRFEAVHRAEVKSEALINQAESHNKHMQELKRFLQYYTRFRNHENSYKFEEPFVKTVQEKINILTASLKSLSMANINLKFLEEAVYELLRARRILCGSYVYGFYLEDNGYNKTIFEYLQNELEEATEKLSDAVAQTYLQTPHAKISQLASTVKQKRQELITAVLRGLVPPETPPSLRKSRKRRLPGLMGMDPIDDDPVLSQAILESLENFNPDDPWVKDQHGKHTNISAVFDWPDYDSDDDNVNSSELGTCSRDGCNRARVRNCRTGEIHEFCSLSCKHWDVLKETNSKPVSVEIDPSMDILIALEMSKLQALNCKVLEENESSDDQRSTTDIYFEGGEEGNSTLKTKEPIHKPEVNKLLNPNTVEPSSRDIDMLNISNDDASLPCTTLETTVNFYLKNSISDDSFNFKNLNISEENDNYCKTDKVLFKVLEEASGICAKDEETTFQDDLM